MASHLRFDTTTGKVETKTKHGKHTEELLQLNEPETVQFRLGVITTVRLFTDAIKEMKADIAEIHDWYTAGKISSVQRDAELLTAQTQVDSLTRTLQAHNGELPLKPLRKLRVRAISTAP